LTCISLSITGTRSVLIIYFLVVIFLFSGLRRYSVVTYVVVYFVLIFLFIVSIYFMRATELEKATVSLSDMFLKHFLLYIFGGIKGFDIFLSNNLPVYDRQFAMILGLPMTGTTDFVSVGPDLTTNVYSAFAVYIYHIGFAGALVLVFFVFTLVGVVYEFSYQNILIYLISCFVLATTVLTIFHDYFFSLGPYVGRLFVIYLLLYVLKLGDLTIKRRLRR
jgi:hypothetical protein